MKNQFILFMLISATDCLGLFTAQHQKLLLVVVDGLRWDKFGLELSSLQRLEDNGVRADWLDNVFVTYTTPNLYSIATGLYPDSHGVIHNIVFNATTRNSTHEFEDALNNTDYFDTGVEPIWVSAKLFGKKVASIMYAGTAVPIKGILSDRIVYLSQWTIENYSLKNRGLDAISWIADEDFDLGLVYMNLPDYTLHDNRIETEASHNDIFVADAALNSILDDVKQRGLWDTLNVIVVSDHGHVNIEPEKFISLTDYINEEHIDFSVFYGTALSQLKPLTGKLNTVYHQLKNAHPALHVYKKEEFPEHFHYGNHPRNLPIIAYVDVGWHIHMTFDPLKDSIVLGSNHGYDNRAFEMKASFYARGPSFKSNFRARPLESVDLYQMMCDILDIDAAPNNGSRDRYIQMMKNSRSSNIVQICVTVQHITVYYLIIMVIICVLGVRVFNLWRKRHVGRAGNHLFHSNKTL